MTGSFSSLMVSEVSPLRHVWDIAARGQGKDSTAYETYCALPSPSKPYSNHDYAVVAEVIREAESAVAEAYKRGEGSGIITLQSILQSYELVLPRHGIRPDEDTYYYRLLLKLSLDQEADWWAKLAKESNSIIRHQPLLSSGSASASSSSGRSVQWTRDTRTSSSYRVSPALSTRTTGIGSSRRTAAGTASSVIAEATATAGVGSSARRAPFRSPAPRGASSDQGSEESFRGSSQARSTEVAPWGATASRQPDPVAPRAATAEAARIASAQAARAAALQASAERAGTVRQASWDAAREAVVQEVAVQEALQAAREAMWEAGPPKAPARDASDLEAVQVVAAREAARQAAAGAREAVNAARQAALYAAREDAAREAAARDAAARESADREAFWELARQSMAREELLRAAALEEAKSRADAEAVFRREPAVRPGVESSAATETAAAAAGGLAQEASLQSAFLATAEAEASVAAARNALLAARQGLRRPSHAFVHDDGLNSSPRSSVSMPSTGAPSLPAESRLAPVSSISIQSTVPTYREAGGIPRPHPHQDAGYRAAVPGGASSGFGAGASVRSVVSGSIRSESGTHTEGAQQGVRSYAMSASERDEMQSVCSDMLRGGAMSSPRGVAPPARDSAASGPGATRTGPMTYNVSRFIAERQSGPPSTATGLDSASAYSATAASSAEGITFGSSASGWKLGTQSDSPSRVGSGVRMAYGSISGQSEGPGFSGRGAGMDIRGARLNDGGGSASISLNAPSRSSSGYMGATRSGSGVAAGSSIAGGGNSSQLAGGGYSVRSMTDSDFSSSYRTGGPRTTTADSDAGCITGRGVSTEASGLGPTGRGPHSDVGSEHGYGGLPSASSIKAFAVGSQWGTADVEYREEVLRSGIHSGREISVDYAANVGRMPSAGPVASRSSASSDGHVSIYACRPVGILQGQQVRSEASGPSDGACSSYRGLGREGSFSFSAGASSGALQAGPPGLDGGRSASVPPLRPPPTAWYRHSASEGGGSSTNAASAQEPGTNAAYLEPNAHGDSIRRIDQQESAAMGPQGPTARGQSYVPPSLGGSAISSQVSGYEAWTLDAAARAEPPPDVRVPGGPGDAGLTNPAAEHGIAGLFSSGGPGHGGGYGSGLSPRFYSYIASVPPLPRTSAISRSGSGAVPVPAGVSGINASQHPNPAQQPKDIMMPGAASGFSGSPYAGANPDVSFGGARGCAEPYLPISPDPDFSFQTGPHGRYGSGGPTALAAAAPEWSPHFLGGGSPPARPGIFAARPAFVLAGGFGTGGFPRAVAASPAARDAAASPDEDDSVLQEETEAYMDFSRMARAFRTWRMNTTTRQTYRSERDHALHNWAVATSFWAVQLLRRCFNRWRGLGPRKAVIAEAVWGDHSRAGCFRRWLVLTRYLRSRSVECDRAWRRRLLQRCWRHLRQYTWSRQRKAALTYRVRSAWAAKTLRACVRAWRIYKTAKQQKALAVQRASAVWAGRCLHVCWREWKRLTDIHGRMALALGKAEAFWSERWLRISIAQWCSFAEAQHRKTLARRRANEFRRRQQLRACWNGWRSFTTSKQRKVYLVTLALEFWMGSSLRGCWRQWREFAAARQQKGLALLKAHEYRTTRALGGCLNWWRQYAVHHQRKILGLQRAVDLWISRTLGGCWSAWRRLTADRQRKRSGLALSSVFWTTRLLRGCLIEWLVEVEESRQKLEAARHMFMHRVLLKWRSEALVMAKLSTAYDAIRQADQQRVLLAGMQAIVTAYVERNDTSRLLRIALLHLRRQRLVRAVRLWRQALQHLLLKRERQALADSWALSRSLAKSWTAWREAMALSREAMQVARQHAEKALRPLLRDAFHSWLEWHDDRMLRRARDVEGRRIMEARRQRLALRAWRERVQEKYHLASAFQLIMRKEVQRLLGSGFRQLRGEYEGTRRASEVRSALQQSTRRRCLLLWKALGASRLAKEEWRLHRLHFAMEQRMRRLLLAWQLVASIRAEHDRIAMACIARRHRHMATTVIRAWRERVLRSVAKRMKMLAALLAWEKGMKSKAWRSWRHLLSVSRASATRFAVAARHHRTRRMGLCFGVMMAQRRQYKALMERALLYRSMHDALLQGEVLHVWRQILDQLRWRNIRMRRAKEHARNRLLASSLYGWFYITRHRLATKQAVAVAVLHWVHNRRAAAFVFWRNWAVYKIKLNTRCTMYTGVRAVRTKAWVLLMLRANVARNARITTATTHRQRYIMRLALSGWLLRTLLAGEWAGRLGRIAEQLATELLASAMAAWLEYVAYRRHKRGLVKIALHYWRLGRQRSALDSLRWNATRRQIKRAAVWRGRQGAAARVLRAWREEAAYRRSLRDQYVTLVANTRNAVLKHGLDSWRAYHSHRANRRSQYERASRHLMRGRMHRALQGWHAYHRHLNTASRHAQSIVRRWNNREAASVLAALAENAEHSRRMRAAEAHHSRVLAAKGMRAWREFLALEQALGFWSHNRLTEILAAWSQYVRRVRGVRATGDLVAARRRNLLAAQVLASWRCYAVKHARLMALGLQLANRTNRGALTAIFTCWREYASNRARLRRVLLDVAGRTCTKLLASALLEWHVVAARRSFLRQTGGDITARCQRSVLSSAFGHWCTCASKATRLRLASEQLSRLTRRSTLSQILGAWCSQTARAVRLQSVADLVAARLRRSCLSGVLRTWHMYTAEKAQLRSTADLALQHMLLRTADQVLGAWRQYSDYRRHLRGVEAHLSSRMRRGTAGAVLDAWRSYAEYTSQLRWAAETVAGQLHETRLRRTLDAFRWYADYRVYFRAKFEMLSGRVHQRLLGSCLAVWHTRADYKAKLASAEERVAAHARQALTLQVLGAWHGRAAYKAHLRQAKEAISQRLRREVLYGIVASWREYARHMAGLKGLLERVLLRSTALAFFGWRKLTEEAKRWRAVQAETQERLQQAPTLKETALYAVTRLRCWPLSVVFYTWYDNVQETRYLREKTTQAVFTYAGTLVHNAWAVWLAYTLRHRYLRLKLARFQAVMRLNRLRAVLHQWSEVAHYLQSLNYAALSLRDKVFERILREAFESWHGTTLKWIRLKSILARIVVRHLETAWRGWLEAVREGRARAQVTEALHIRVLRRDLRAALAAWRQVARSRAAAQRMAVRCRQGLLLCALWGWQEVAFQSGLQRGKALHAGHLVRRVLQGWRAVATDARRGILLQAQLQELLVRAAVHEWRQQWLARAAFRRLYSRRALLGWYERTQELRAMRARLWHAARIMLQGLMFRCFSAWWQHAQAMGIKRAVFIRKQRALAEALRRGDELAAMRNAELLELAYRGWKLRAGILKQVRRRLQVLRTRMLAASLAGWVEHTRLRKLMAAKQAEVVRHRLLARPLRAWLSLTVIAAAKMATAGSHRRASLIGRAVGAWFAHHQAMAARKAALHGALAVGRAAAASALKARAWDAWCEALIRRVARLELMDEALQRRRVRQLGAVFDVWLKYTQAMQSGGIDAGSPYLSPRDDTDDRRLVMRMAALAGNDQAFNEPHPSVLDGLYLSPALKQAMERRQGVDAFLSSARAGAATPRLAASMARGRLAVTAMERQRERRDSQSSTVAASSSSQGSGSSAVSSGAGGADLAELALALVRAAPGLSPAGKTRGVGEAMNSALRAAQAAAATPRPLVPLSPDFGSSPYDDRLDLRALYDPQVGGPPAWPQQGSFGGFVAGRQASDSPRPLPRPPTPLTASHPIAPRRIDFSVGRGVGRAAGGHIQAQQGYTPASRQAKRPGSAVPAEDVRRHPRKAPAGLNDNDSDGASTTSSDLLGPPQAPPSRPMAVALRGNAPSWDAGAALGNQSARQPPRTMGQGSGQEPSVRAGYGMGSGLAGVQGVGRAGGAVFLGGSLARQVASGRGTASSGAAGSAPSRGSILDARTLGGR